MHRKPRRFLAIILIIFGGLLMWLAPDVSAFGLSLLVLGIVIEVVGIYLEHKDGTDR